MEKICNLILIIMKMLFLHYQLPNSTFYFQIIHAQFLKFLYIWLIKISFYWNGSNILLTWFGRGPFRWFSSFYEWIQTWQFNICSNQKSMKWNLMNKMHYLILKPSTEIFETLAETSSVHNQESLDVRDQEMYIWNA